MQDGDLMGPIVASREFIWTRIDGATFPAFAEIGVPFQLPPNDDGTAGDWACKVRTRGLGDNSIQTVVGVDTIQAIYLAMVQAGFRVGQSVIASDLDFAALPNYGFPPPPVAPNGPAGAGCVPCQ